MSVQFGRWNFDGKPVDPSYLEKVNTVLAPYGPDGASSYSQENISFVYHAFHTTRESRRESQPHITASGAVITWDGRLDNREELIRESTDVLTTASTDVAIVGAGYERWGNRCFAKLIGDWALSIWDPHTRSLTLAKDPIGTRHLYYSLDKNHVTWSTILDPLVLFADKTFALCEEYIAGCLSLFPAAHLTPYVGIHSVPPSTSAVVRCGNHTMRRYWDFDSSKRIRHNTDAEYEEHFRAAFGEAVRRRLRSDSPILAELSGGMDSSSIVCMADNIIAGDGSETSRLDTISYFNEFEPNWNERPYFEKVEARRGRAGCHIDVGTRENTAFELDDTRFLVSPGSGEANPTEASKRFADYLRMMGNRVLLSGIGGDEVTCGVPSPSPQLADLLARGHFRTLAHQLKVWALNKRKPWFYLLFDAARGFFPPPLFMPKYKRPVPWLNRDFVKRNRSALRGYEARLKLFFGGLPSFQDNMNTLDGLRRQLAYACPRPGSLYEKRFPYLDRDLLEFLYTIPQEQLLRPGQRRSLMRRSLVGIVPNEILERKRKAFVSRALVSSINEEWQTWSEVSQHMLTTSAGITDAEAFHRLLERAKKGEDVQTARLLATFGIERWLRHVNRWTRANKGPETTQTKQTADQPYELSVALR